MDRQASQRIFKQENHRMPMMSREPNKTMDAVSGRVDQHAPATNRLDVLGQTTSMTETAVHPKECGRFPANDAGLHIAYAGILVAIIGMMMQACSLPGTMPPGEKSRNAGIMLLGVFFSLAGAGLTVTGLVALSI